MEPTLGIHATDRVNVIFSARGSSEFPGGEFASPDESCVVDSTCGCCAISHVFAHVVLDDEEDIFRVGVESRVGEGEGERAVGVFVVADPGSDVGVIQVRAPSAEYQLVTGILKLNGLTYPDAPPITSRKTPVAVAPENLPRQRRLP